MNPNVPDSFEAQIAELCSRIYRLEQTLLSHGIALEKAVPLSSVEAPVSSLKPPQAISPPATVAVPAQGVPQPPPARSPQAPVVPPSLVNYEQAHKEDTRSLENRIGSQWFNRVGILAMLNGVSWFLKLAFDNHWIGPLGRVFIGLLAGAARIAWSERFEKR